VPAVSDTLRYTLVAARSQTRNLTSLPLAAAEPMQMRSCEIDLLVLSFNFGGDGFRNALEIRGIG
jgi:hypothetical protein